MLCVDVSVNEERIIDGLLRNLLASERTSANLSQNIYIGTSVTDIYIYVGTWVIDIYIYTSSENISEESRRSQLTTELNVYNNYRADFSESLHGVNQ